MATMQQDKGRSTTKTMPANPQSFVRNELASGLAAQARDQ
jgi:hypothetical protein